MVKQNRPKRDLRRQRKNAMLPPVVLTPIARDHWGDAAQAQESLKELWISREFTVQIYNIPLPEGTDFESHKGPLERLTVTHTGISTPDKANAITRDQLMEVKLQCGRGGQWAVEVFPDIDRGVSVPEARHLFVYYGKPEFC